MVFVLGSCGERKLGCSTHQVTGTHTRFPTMSVERIYIGGLEPPRLKGSEILSRLQSLSDVEIQSVIANEDKTFVHLTAVSTGDASALEIISKAYHNVKWKGCKLSVAMARPHFLERLAEEVRQRQEGKEKAALLATDPQQTESKHNEDPNIPRRLRIRRKFGDEAFHVDTKPVVAEDWSNFSRAIHKVRKRREKHFNKTDEVASASHSTSFMNRAVHLRFGDKPKKPTANVTKSDDSAEANLLTEASGGDDDNVVSSSSSEDEESVSAKEDAESDLEKENDPVKEKKSGYGWSDDSASEDEDEGDEDKIQEFKEDDKVAPSTEPTANKKEPTAQGYEWSSDESSSDGEPGRTVSKRPLKPHAATDEFAAGMGDFNDDYNANQPDWTLETEDSQVDRAESSDLVNDVSGNLNILSSIFPNMSNTKPVAQPETVDASESGKEKEREPSRSGWGSGGLMLRFDPNAESAQQFLVDESLKNEDEAENDKDARVEAEAKDDEEMASVSDGDSYENSERSNTDVKAETKPGRESAEEEGSDNESESEASKEEPAQEEANRVYEQGKLEDVFRNAREAWHDVGGSAADIPVDAPATSGSSMANNGASFSFGFDLGKPEEKKEPKTAAGSGAGFSFSFSLGEDQTEQQKPQAPTGIEQKNFCEEADTKNEMISAPDEATPEVRRRKGSALPKDVLESYQSTFFALNDGTIIMEDVDGFRRDEGVKEQWNHERQTLTLDWKRKRKFAQSRMEKRRKFR
jgi:hypothetical protein